MKYIFLFVMFLNASVASASEIAVLVEVGFTKNPKSTTLSCLLRQGYQEPHIESYQKGTGRYQDHGGEITETVVTYSGIFTRYDITCRGTNLYVNTYEPELFEKQNDIYGDRIDYRHITGQIDIKPLLKSQQNEVCDTGTLRGVAFGDSEPATLCIRRIN